MSFVEVLQAWASLSLRKMVITAIVILVGGAGYIYDRHGDKIQWLTPLQVNATFLKKQLATTSFDYVGVFKYEYRVPYGVSEMSKACSSSMEICYKTKEYFLHKDLSRIAYHMQNQCEVKQYPSGDEVYGMKVIGSCPIIVDKTLKGYVMGTAMLNADQEDMEKFLRKTAEIIADK